MKKKTQPAAENHHDTALLVIDVQRGLFKKSTPIYQADELLKNIGALVDRAHRAGAPVFYVQHSDKRDLSEGSEGWQLHPQLHPTDTDHVIHKRHASAFQETDLEKALEARHIKSLVVTGLVTHGCVRATCIDAHRRGYKVILVKDGHGNFHKHAAELVKEWNQKLSERGIQIKPARETDF